MTISNTATGLRPGVCTSTTRPTSPYTGMIIYETDTGYLLVWDGAAWDYLSQKQDNTVGLGPVGGLVYVGGGAFSGTTSYNNVFTSTFRNYRIIVSNTSFTGSATLAMRLRTGGVDQGSAGADYFTAYLGFYVTGATNNATINGGSYWFFPISSSTALANFGLPASMDIFSPQLSTRTHAHVMSHGYDNNYFFRHGMATYNTSTSCDGFTLYSTSANAISGNVEIYGYRNP